MSRLARASAPPPASVPAVAPGESSAASFAGTWLRGARFWRVLAAAVLGTFLVRLSYFVLHDLADGRPDALPARVFDETTGGLLSAPAFAGLLWLARRRPLVRPIGRRTVAAYGAAFVAVTVLHTTAMIVVRATLAPAVGLTGYAYAFPAARYGYEAVNTVFPAVAGLALLALAESVYAERARERRAAALEGSLLRAELGNLRLQLQPHFLFNALNTIADTMYEDVAAADAQLAQLADLLRTSLRTTHAHEVPAREELALLGQYVGLLRARFGDRFDVAVHAPPDVGDLLVPSMVLQPLVENAVRHGGLSRVGRGRVTVTLARAAAAWGPALMLRVYDDGPGPEAPGTGGAAASTGAGLSGGTGLSATRQRLGLLYGGAHAMRAGPAPRGGFEAVLWLPAHTRPHPPASAPGGALAAPARPAAPAGAVA